jgi:hypothetical protein
MVICISRPDRARVEVERRPRGGSASGDTLHEREPHVLRRLPVPLPLIDEPVVDLLWIEAGHRSEPHLILFLSRPPCRQITARSILFTVLTIESSEVLSGCYRGVRPAVVCVPPVHQSPPSVFW